MMEDLRLLFDGMDELLIRFDSYVDGLVAAGKTPPFSNKEKLAVRCFISWLLENYEVAKKK